MELFKTGKQITQAVKNVGRLKQIVGVLARHGFDEVLSRTELARFIPGGMKKDSASEALSLPERTRTAFEELGPTFVKLGQLLASRPDMVPKAFVDEFKKLQDNVATIPYSAVKTVIESELGASVEFLFQSLEQTPLASASIGQVHQATLHSGDQVIVKVQRPGIKETITSDISILSFLANVLESQIPEARIIGPTRIVDEFFKTMELEMNYTVEMNNARRIAENFSKETGIVIPKVYPEMTTDKVLVMEKLNGIRFSDIESIKNGPFDNKELVKVGVEALFKMIMEDGLFHGDLHAGNLFALPGNRIGIIDFGMMGRLSQKSQDHLLKMFVAIVDEDFESLCYEFIELGEYPGTVNMDQFVRDVSNKVGPYIGLNLGEVNLGKVLMESTSIAVKHHVQIPSEWMMVFKAILTIEGLGRTLDPELDLLALSTDISKRMIENRFSPRRITKEIAYTLRDLNSLVQVLPRHIKTYTKKLAKNDYAIELRIKELDGIRRESRSNFKLLSLSILSASLFITGALCLGNEQIPTLFTLPWVTTITWLFAGVFSAPIILRIK